MLFISCSDQPARTEFDSCWGLTTQGDATIIRLSQLHSHLVRIRTQRCLLSTSSHPQCSANQAAANFSGHWMHAWSSDKYPTPSYDLVGCIDLASRMLHQALPATQWAFLGWTWASHSYQCIGFRRGRRRGPHSQCTWWLVRFLPGLQNQKFRRPLSY